MLTTFMDLKGKWWEKDWVGNQFMMLHRLMIHSFKRKRLKNVFKDIGNLSGYWVVLRWQFHIPVQCWTRWCVIDLPTSNIIVFNRMAHIKLRPKIRFFSKLMAHIWRWSYLRRRRKAKSSRNGVFKYSTIRISYPLHLNFPPLEFAFFCNLYDRSKNHSFCEERAMTLSYYACCLQDVSFA